MTWDEIYKGVLPMVDKVAEAVGQVTDLASLELKRATQEKALSGAYAKLGKLFYASVTSDTKNLDAEIAEAVRTVATEQKRLAAIEARLKELKERNGEKHESV